jgi:alpha-L-fucosidase
LISDLVDVVSKNGALLLNIGARADGAIPEQAAEMLRAIGRWLAVNGEAVYASRPWNVFGEGPTEVASGSFTDADKPPYTSQDIRFTTRGETLYATFLAWPDNGRVVITSLAEQKNLYPGSITHVELLGSDIPVSWVRDAAGLRVELPVDKPFEHAGVLKITA